MSVGFLIIEEEWIKYGFRIYPFLKEYLTSNSIELINKREKIVVYKFNCAVTNENLNIYIRIVDFLKTCPKTCFGFMIINLTDSFNNDAVISLGSTEGFGMQAIKTECATGVNIKLKLSAKFELVQTCRRTIEPDAVADALVKSGWL